MAWYDDFFGGRSNQPAFNQYSDQMRQAAGKFDPWVQRGNQAGDMSFEMYQRLMNDPNFLQNQIASGYQESPFQTGLMNRTTNRMNMNAANSGMMTSPAAQRALNDEMQQMSGQFANQYIDRGMSSFGQGLQGMGNLNQMGLSAVQEQIPLEEQAAGGELQGMRGENDRQSNKWGNMFGAGLGLAGNVAGGFFGGPAGALAGRGAGGWFGNWLHNKFNGGGGAAPEGGGSMRGSNYEWLS